VFCGAIWTCAKVTGAAQCGAASGSGVTLNDQPKLLNSDTVQYKIITSICASSTGSLTNTAVTTVGSDYSDPTPGISTDVNSLFPVADLSIIKSDSQNISAPGAHLTYTILVTNSGPSNVLAGVSVVDSFSSNFVTPLSWNCVASSGFCTG